MSIPRNTAPQAGADATPASGALRRRAVMVGNLVAASGLFFFAACAERGVTEPGGARAEAAGASQAVHTYTHTVTTGSGTVTTASSTGTNGDTARVTLSISPTTTATFQVNVHRVFITAGSICDPATSGYGVGTWDRPCTPAKTTVRVTAKAWTNKSGHPVVVFSPDLRFVPGKVNTIRLLDRNAAAQQVDPLTWCPTGTTACVNEAQSDPTLATVYTSDGYASRRIKHFSGFTMGFGAW